MRSLRSRLTFTHTLVALVAVIIVAVLSVVLIRSAFNQLTVQRAQLDAEMIAGQVSDLYQLRQSWDGVPARLKQRQDRQAQSQPSFRRRIQLFDDNRNLLYDSAGPVQRRQLPQPIQGASSPVVVNGRTVGTVVVGEQRGIFNQAERAFLRGVYLIVVIGTLVAVVGAFVVGLLISGRVTRPLRAFTDAAQRLALGAHHEPLTAPPDVELAELAQAFNTMAAELEHQQQLRRQLVADIAHELRTPLSVLRLQLESMEDGIEQPTPPMLASLTEEVGLLSRLVDDLRLLSLVDAGQLSLAIAEVDAHAALERALATAAPRARQLGIDLRAERPPAPLLVAADPQRLAQILGNLIENALRYTSAGGQVRVCLRIGTAEQILHNHAGSTAAPAETRRPALPAQPPAYAIFEIVDTGPGIAPDELPQIFERFYRTDKARSRETGGSGLGLVIVQRLVEMQNGHIWVTSALGSGTTFHVALPAAAAPLAGTYSPRPLTESLRQ
jgi:signal transduction histidine kinase